MFSPLSRLPIKTVFKSLLLKFKIHKGLIIVEKLLFRLFQKFHHHKKTTKTTRQFCERIITDLD